MDIGRLLAFAVKEEILRNVLKSHQRALVLGFAGTGKTVCTLRTLVGLSSPCYFSPLPFSSDALKKHAPGVTALSALTRTPPADLPSPALIVDGVNKLPPEQILEVINILKNPGSWQKVVLISQVLIDSKELMPNIDVVVKMKEKTAEMLYSKLLETN